MPLTEGASFLSFIIWKTAGKISAGLKLLEVIVKVTDEFNRNLVTVE